MTLNPGARLGPYEVSGLLGAGGMGEVYRARDTRLDRDVAIKVLPAAFAADPDRLHRFEREARATAALNHPNILAIHDVGSHGGVPYLVEELLEGESLRARLQSGARSPRTAAELAVQICSGLAAAHEKGIVHRDLKPENLFLTTDGLVKILDFGLAKHVAPVPSDSNGDTATRGTPPATQAGWMLGTVGYMSPEQVRGEPADARSDIFSLGCVLFEMVGGRRAFDRKTGIETLHAILSEDPPPLASPSGPVPSSLERIIRRCLEKRSADRFASAADARFALQSWLDAPSPAPAAARPADESIVVLPFDNLSPDPDNAFLADGLTEEVIADLAKVRTLRVISRTSAMLLRGSKKDVPTIARELNVRYALEGSVRRAGQSLRITAQLIDAERDAHVWAEKYSGTVDDVFDMQERVSRAIVDALKLTLTTDEKRRFAARAIPDVRAFELYMQARQECYRLDEDALDHATRLAREALDIVGPNALLYALLAEIEFFFHDQGIHADAETLRRAESWTDQALELDPDSAAGLGARGIIRQRRGDMLGAVRDLCRAAERQPSGQVLGFLVWILSEVGRMKEARQHAAEAVAIDPLLWLAWWASVWVALLDGEFETALQHVRRCVELGRGGLIQLFFQGIASAYAGRLEDACGLFDRVAKSGAKGISIVAVALSTLFRGDAEKARGLLGAQDLRDLASLDKEFSWWLASACSYAGETDEALRWLSNAIDLGFVNERFLATIDPFLAALRGDSRFEALMARAREKQRVFQA
jgi:serine/threonine protein kinase/tetratricopeptide (TPR) repeat protein